MVLLRGERFPSAILKLNAGSPICVAITVAK